MGFGFFPQISIWRGVCLVMIERSASGWIQTLVRDREREKLQISGNGIEFYPNDSFKGDFTS